MCLASLHRLGSQGTRPWWWEVMGLSSQLTLGRKLWELGQRSCALLCPPVLETTQVALPDFIQAHPGPGAQEPFPQKFWLLASCKKFCPLLFPLSRHPTHCSQ